MQLNKIIFIVFVSVLISSTIAQENFIKAYGNKFILNKKEFRFLGFNAYYLQSEAGLDNRKYIVDEVMQAAERIGSKVIRTWAFNEDKAFSNPSVIRKSPYEFQESGLIALDYVLQKAREHRIYLIFTLSNNFPGLGGVSQYIEWANDRKLNGSDKYTHKDFFEKDSIKWWFKYYISILLHRTNTLTGIKYKDDPTIFAWEIMNEAENPFEDFILIKNWYKEISSFIKTIDPNHLITTGETGYDSFLNLYSDADLMYNSSYFLFNGYKGTSFYQNSFTKSIDYVSFHCYPDGWGLTSKAGNTWIQDHYQLAEEFNKPCLLGEFGIKENKLHVYKEWLELIKRSSFKSAVVWQYLHPDVINNDGYGFNENSSPEIVELFKDYIKEIDYDTLNNNLIPGNIVLYQNYPNPFNPVTTIKYSLPEKDFITLALYSTVGELIGILDYGFKEKGEYQIILSFDNELLGSGVYFFTLHSSEKSITKKLLLIK
ncbi:MAG: cellulase family glycosylhydrolase [Ignavibacteriaceae bacterium]|nr:cellulase family glycosylhydrolase [Ignavibacteriaceae bacterium]